ALTIYGNFNSVLGSFEHFNLYLLPILLVLSFLTFFTRFYKWHYYIRLLKIKISIHESFFIFMSSLIMLATPGALGELFKSYLVKQITGEQISKTAPIIFSERITDFISVIFIALAGAILYNYGIFIMTLLIIIFLVLIIFITVSVMWAGFVYAFGTIIGSLTMLPGGVGVTDGSFVFLIVQKGFSKDAAIASTFIIRSVTLWFAVAVGAIFIFLYKSWFSDLYNGDNILSLDNDE
ncbi:MAG: lysylphosphatidylglycerol synthase domain-containing protein, partial [Ignavibacteriaceae bacterium]